MSHRSETWKTVLRRAKSWELAPLVIRVRGHVQIFFDMMKLSMHAFNLSAHVLSVEIAIMELVVYVFYLPEHASELSPNVAIAAINANLVPNMPQHAIQMTDLPRE